MGWGIFIGICIGLPLGVAATFGVLHLLVSAEDAERDEQIRLANLPVRPVAEHRADVGAPTSDSVAVSGR